MNSVLFEKKKKKQKKNFQTPTATTEKFDY